MKKLLFIMLMTLIAGAGMLTAVNFSQDVIDYSLTDLDVSLSGADIFSLTITPGSAYDLDFDPEIEFNTESVTAPLESALSISVNPDISLDNLGASSIDVGLDIAYINSIYFTPDAVFPVGMQVNPTIDFDFSDAAGIDLDAQLYLAFIAGRVIDQSLLLEAKLLADVLGVNVSDAELRNIAERIALYQEPAGGLSDLQEEEFAADVANMLGIPGSDLQVVNALNRIRGHRHAVTRTGFEFDLGFETTYSMSGETITIRALPNFMFAGNFGDAIWFSVQGAAWLNAVELDLTGVTPATTFEFDEMDAFAQALLNWYISPAYSLCLDTVAFFEDFLGTTPSIGVGTTLSLDLDISDSLDLVFEIPVTIIPNVTADFGIYFNWDIL